MIAGDVTFDRVFTELNMSPIPVRVEPGYPAASPLVVQVLFGVGDEHIEWSRRPLLPQPAARRSEDGARRRGVSAARRG